MYNSLCHRKPPVKQLQRLCFAKLNGLKFCSSQNDGDDGKPRSEEKVERQRLRSVNIGKPKGKKYPQFLAGKKPGLDDLLQELKASKEIPVPKDELQKIVKGELGTFTDENQYLMEKVSPDIRVIALNKHAEVGIIKKTDSGTVENGKDEDAPGASAGKPKQKPTIKKAMSEIRKETKKTIIPDQSEVGSLMKALMQEKLEDDQVTDIISKVKPGPNIVARMSETVNMAMRGEGKMTRSEKAETRKQSLRSGNRSGEQDYRFQKRNIPKGVNLFVGPKSNYFDSLFEKDLVDEKPRFVSRHELAWQEMLKNSVQKRGPSNRFEEMMLQSEKLWNLPVDNESGLDEDNPSTFEDHVFLDHHLELFPETGQLKRFMELVVTGLQQNPFITVQQKVETIHWFKDYFDKFSESDLEL